MSNFIGHLILRSLSVQEIKRAGRAGTQLYEIREPFSYRSSVLYGHIVTVPAGYVTDFASIPRIAWNILDPESPIIGWPSVIHDWLYSNHGKLPDGFTYARENADEVLREAMELQGAGAFIRSAVFNAVQLFGKSHWKS